MPRYVEINIDTLEWGESFETKEECQEHINLRPDAENWAIAWFPTAGEIYLI